jgi:hypothetical protein
MANNKDFVPEEIDTQNQLLIQSLRQAYRLSPEDARSLAKIQERLQATPPLSLQGPHAMPNRPIATEPRNTEYQIYPLPSRRANAMDNQPRRRFRSYAMGLVAILVVGLLVGSFVLLLASRHNAPGTANQPVTTTTPTTPASPTPPNAVPFTVTGVDLSVTPNSIADKTCGSLVNFTYTAIFHLPAHTAGGTIQFAYTLNNGRSQTTGSLKAGAGETSKTFTFVSSGTLPTDHTYPGTAIVMVTSPNTISSPPVEPGGACVVPGPFQVTSVSMTVNPDSIAGTSCGTFLTVTYTALFHLAPNGPGGTIQFEYTVNNGRGSNPASIKVAPGQTTASYSFQWSGNLPPDHTYPEQGGVIVQSPNAINSPLLGPSGTCK